MRASKCGNIELCGRVKRNTCCCLAHGAHIARKGACSITPGDATGWFRPYVKSRIHRPRQTARLTDVPPWDSNPFISCSASPSLSIYNFLSVCLDCRLKFLILFLAFGIVLSLSLSLSLSVTSRVAWIFFVIIVYLQLFRLFRLFAREQLWIFIR